MGNKSADMNLFFLFYFPVGYNPLSGIKRHTYLIDFSAICHKRRCIAFIFNLLQSLVCGFVTLEFKKIDEFFCFHFTVNPPCKRMHFTECKFSEQCEYQIDDSLKIMFKQSIRCSISNSCKQCCQDIFDAFQFTMFNVSAQCKNRPVRKP